MHTQKSSQEDVRSGPGAMRTELELIGRTQNARKLDFLDQICRGPYIPSRLLAAQCCHQSKQAVSQRKFNRFNKGFYVRIYHESFSAVTTCGFYYTAICGWVQGCANL
jgi:hypothetical protein